MANLVPVTQTSKKDGSKHHSNKEDGSGCFVFSSSITHKVPLVQISIEKGHIHAVLQGVHYGE